MKVFLVAFLSASLAFSAVGASVSPVPPPNSGESSSGPSVTAAAVRGAQAAAHDIRDGVTRILTFGRLGQFATGNDSETSYPVLPVAGCVVTERFVAEVEAYNDTMRKWCATHKP